MAIRKATERFPRTGYGELKAQMTGSAESISNNIVEGAGASSRKEFARFLTMSIRSTMELENQLQQALAYEILPVEQWRARTAETIEIRKMIYGYRSHVLEDS